MGRFLDSLLADSPVYRITREDDGFVLVGIQERLPSSMISFAKPQTVLAMSLWPSPFPMVIRVTAKCSSCH